MKLVEQEKYVVVIDEDGNNFDYLERDKRLKDKIVNLSDFSQKGSDNFNLTLSGLMEKKASHVSYSSARRGIGIDYGYPESAHVVANLDITSTAQCLQVLGRGARKAEGTAHGTLLVPYGGYSSADHLYEALPGKDELQL